MKFLEPFLQKISPKIRIKGPIISSNTISEKFQDTISKKPKNFHKHFPKQFRHFPIVFPNQFVNSFLKLFSETPMLEKHSEFVNIFFKKDFLKNCLEKYSEFVKGLEELI